MLAPQDRAHRRLNPLTGEHVLVSPGRSRRPWQGRQESAAAPPRPAHDPECYLCPGNARAGGQRNPAYEGTFVFVNDFSALRPREGSEPAASDPLFTALPEGGLCKVVCFSPRHDLTLPELPVADIDRVLETWARESAILGAREDIACVQVFENKGELMGCSNPHPHSQIWATESLTDAVAKELARQRRHLEAHGRPLLAEYLERELEMGERLVVVNDFWAALVPFWAQWPFETLVLPRFPARDLPGLSPRERFALADLLKRLTIRYDNLFEVSFPYSMGFHQAPFDGEDHPEWTLHMHFYPPLLRSATVRKFMVGFEMLGTPGRDITPEAAAEALRGLSGIHYTERGS
jgi:UDPglucose--hexose-1-phosphate uridylyltransferase